MTTTSTNELRKQLSELKVHVALVSASLDTFESKHTKGSATRCRKHLMDIKKLADSLRKNILAASKKPKNSVEPVVVENPDEVQVA